MQPNHHHQPFFFFPKPGDHLYPSNWPKSSLSYTHPHITTTTTTAHTQSLATNISSSASSPISTHSAPRNSHISILYQITERERETKDDGGSDKEEARHGEREGHAGPPRRAASGRVPAGPVRPQDPQQGTQRRGHFPRSLRCFLLGHVPGRQGQQDPQVSISRSPSSSASSLSLVFDIFVLLNDLLIWVWLFCEYGRMEMWGLCSVVHRSLFC